MCVCVCVCVLQMLGISEDSSVVCLQLVGIDDGHLLILVTADGDGKHGLGDG